MDDSLEFHPTLAAKEKAERSVFADRWYVDRAGVLLGPIPTVELQRLVSSGTYPPNTRVSPDPDVPTKPVSELGLFLQGIVSPFAGPLFEEPPPPAPRKLPPNTPEPEKLKRKFEPVEKPPKPASSVPPLAAATGCSPARLVAEIAQCAALTTEQSAYEATLEAVSNALKAAILLHNQEIKDLDRAARALQGLIDAFNNAVADYNAKYDQYEHAIQLLTTIPPAISAMFGDLEATFAVLDDQSIPLQNRSIQIQVWRDDLNTETQSLRDSERQLADTKLKFLALLRSLISQFYCKRCR